MQGKLTLLWSVAVFVAFMGLNGLTFAGELEPSEPPNTVTGKGTMRTLEELHPSWNKRLAADDGDPVTGCGSSRFDCVLGGAAVHDKETGLVWELIPKSPVSSWYDALTYCFTSGLGERGGWRLPTIEELTSLKDTVNTNPSLPTGSPFRGVPTYPFWSSTTYAGGTSAAWQMRFAGAGGSIAPGGKTAAGYAWCVRGSQGHDGY
jgi:hypothetical protein